MILELSPASNVIYLVVRLKPWDLNGKSIIEHRLGWAARLLRAFTFSYIMRIKADEISNPRVEGIRGVLRRYVKTDRQLLTCPGRAIVTRV